ncbi:MAG: hypothetical protein IPM71_12330 [Bacteroidota bacterium]|nr:MAG: hypothetical protein IPM71_12330 [Bacteroidota bacterium]
MATKQEPIVPGRYYHVFNKSVGGEFLFKNHENYRYFMEKYRKYVSPFAETLAWCLMPTHFHFLIKPLGGDKTCGGFEAPDINREGRETQIPNKTYEGFETLAGLAGKGSETLPSNTYEGSETLVSVANFSKKFSHLFNCYAQAYNKQNHRSGSLFKNRFKRVLITDEEHLRTAIVYIHLNPSHHQVEKNFKNWKYSSFNALVGTGQTLVKREKVLELFEGRENFIFCHQQKYEFNTGLYFD